MSGLVNRSLRAQQKEPCRNPAEVFLSDLEPNTRHFYQVRLAQTNTQAVPQPGNESGSAVPRYAAECGYKGGVILGGSGHMRMTVAAAKITADYVSCVLPAADPANRQNASIAHSWSLSATGQGTAP